MKNLYCIAICGIFISLKIHSLNCKDSWRDPERASQRKKNEDFLKFSRGNTGALFFRNFSEGNLQGENSFIVIRGTSSIGRILKTDGSGILMETIDSSGELTQIEITTETGTEMGLGDSHFVFTEDPFFKPYRTRQPYFVIDQGHPGLEVIFQAHQSALKRINSRLLNIPKRRNNKEEELREQGYNSAQVRGISEAEEWIAVGERLRELKPHPYKTHIDYLAEQIKPHIEHIRKRVTNSTQQEVLNRLEKQAEARRKRKAVTYEWWVMFNFDLSEVLYPGSFYSETGVSERRRIQALINQFPFNILMPTKLGFLGIMLISETYPEGIMPVGLLNKKQDVDGLKELSPRGHYLHDIGHAENFLNPIRNTYIGMAYKRFHDRLREKKKNLPIGKRQEVEFGYFVMGHESFSKLVYSSSDHIQESLLSTLRSQIGDGFNFKGLMDFPEDSPQTGIRIYRFTKDFSQFAAPLAENP